MSGDAAVPSLSFLDEPSFIVSADGTFVSANAAGRRFIGQKTLRGPISDHVTEPPEEIAALLRRASRSTSPIPGVLTVVAAGGPVRMRLHAARLSEGSGAPLLILRLLPPNEDRFAALSRRVRELDEQLRQRLREKAELEAALDLNRTLLQELQHRVKNNIQMMMTLIRMSGRDRPGADVAEVVAAASLRLQAMAASQEALYRSSRPGKVAAGPMLEDIVAIVFADDPGRVDAEIGDLEISSESAHCVALIALELIAHAPPRGRTRIRFEPQGCSGRLSVERSGLAPAPGPDLHLVQVLCAQIEASLEIERGGETRVLVHIPVRARGSDA